MSLQACDSLFHRILNSLKALQVFLLKKESSNNIYQLIIFELTQAWFETTQHLS